MAAVYRERGWLLGHSQCKGTVRFRTDGLAVYAQRQMAQNHWTSSRGITFIFSFLILFFNINCETSLNVAPLLWSISAFGWSFLIYNLSHPVSWSILIEINGHIFSIHIFAVAGVQAEDEFNITGLCCRRCARAVCMPRAEWFVSFFYMKRFHTVASRKFWTSPWGGKVSSMQVCKVTYGLKRGGMLGI